MAEAQQQLFSEEPRSKILSPKEKIELLNAERIASGIPQLVWRYAMAEVRAQREAEASLAENPQNDPAAESADQSVPID